MNLKPLVTAFVFVFATLFLSACGVHQHLKGEEIGKEVKPAKMGHLLNLNREQYRKVHLDLSVEEREKLKALIGHPLEVRVLNYTLLRKKRGKGVQGIYFAIEEKKKKIVIFLRREGRISSISLFVDGEPTQTDERLQHLLGHSFEDIQRDIKQKHFQDAPPKVQELIQKISVVMATLKVIHER